MEITLTGIVLAVLVLFLVIAVVVIGHALEHRLEVLIGWAQEMQRLLEEEESGEMKEVLGADLSKGGRQAEQQRRGCGNWASRTTVDLMRVHESLLDGMEDVIFRHRRGDDIELYDSVTEEIKARLCDMESRALLGSCGFKELRVLATCDRNGIKLQTALFFDDGTFAYCEDCANGDLSGLLGDEEAEIELIERISTAER